MIKSKLIRVNIELAKEIERIAKKNNLKFIEGSKEAAKALQKIRNIKIKYELEF